MLGAEVGTPRPLHRMDTATAREKPPHRGRQPKVLQPLKARAVPMNDSLDFRMLSAAIQPGTLGLRCARAVFSCDGGAGDGAIPAAHRPARRKPPIGQLPDWSGLWTRESGGALLLQPEADSPPHPPPFRLIISLENAGTESGQCAAHALLALRREPQQRRLQDRRRQHGVHRFHVHRSRRQVARRPVLRRVDRIPARSRSQNTLSLR